MPSIHDSSPCDSTWILAASSFAFPKMLPELTLLWLLLDESGKGQKLLYPLEREGAGTGKVEGWGGETAISRSLSGKITWLLGQSQEIGKANCFVAWLLDLGGARAWDGSSVKQVHLLPWLCSTAGLCWNFTWKLINSTQPFAQELREPGSGAGLQWQVLIGGQGV